MQPVALIADLHADALTPECRTDNYFDALLEKFKWLMENFKHIIIAGDVFDSWKVDPYIHNRLFSVWDEHVNVYAIPGQHDLPQHSLELIDKSSFQLMVNAGAIQRLSPTEPAEIENWLVYGAGWGEQWPLYNSAMSRTRQLLVAHKTTWMEPFAPGQAAGDAARLLLRNEGWDGIVVGDNHQTFVVRARDRVLVSPGSVMRMRVDQIAHKPAAFTLTKTGVNDNPIFIPCSANSITSVRHVEKKEKDARINVFVERLGEQEEVGMSFHDNLRAYLTANPVEPEVRSIIDECTGG